MARRVPRLSATFRRSLGTLGIQARSPAFRAVFSTINSLSTAEELPGAGDHETTFAPGRAYVRRVGQHNVWVLYRFDDEHVFIMTARGTPPVPVGD